MSRLAIPKFRLGNIPCVFSSPQVISQTLDEKLRSTGLGQTKMGGFQPRWGCAEACQCQLGGTWMMKRF